eukprot:5312608-Amphidinium_carterae.1
MKQYVSAKKGDRDCVKADRAGAGEGRCIRHSLKVHQGVELCACAGKWEDPHVEFQQTRGSQQLLAQTRTHVNALLPSSTSCAILYQLQCALFRPGVLVWGSRKSVESLS